MPDPKETSRPSAVAVFMLMTSSRRHKIPAIYQDRAYVSDGGLMSYGANFVAAFRLGGRYVGQILKGAKPTDLPVDNRRYSPPMLLIRADDLIE